MNQRLPSESVQKISPSVAGKELGQAGVCAEATFSTTPEVPGETATSDSAASANNPATPMAIRCRPAFLIRDSETPGLLLLNAAPIFRNLANRAANPNWCPKGIASRLD